jgi:hypothetical protein
MARSKTDLKNAIYDMAAALRDVFKQYPRSIRRRAWKRLTGPKGHHEMEKVLNQTSRPLARFKMLQFSEWFSLQEYFLGIFPFPDSKTDLKIYKNPGHSELQILLGKMDYKEARGILLPNGAVYIWEGGSVVHQDVADTLKKYGETTTDAPSDVLRFYALLSGGETVIQGYDREEQVLAHPSILAILGRKAA